MKKAITAAIAASVLMIGCTNQSTEVRKLQAENDSLLIVCKGSCRVYQRDGIYTY